MFNKTIRLRIIATAATLLLASQAAYQADAAIIYGDFIPTPPGVMFYNDVSESSSSDPVPPPLYGTPSISGNTLDFDPTGFGATATGNAPGADLTDGQLNFGFQTTRYKPSPNGPYSGLRGIQIEESGDFTMFSTGSALTAVSAGLYAKVDITHVSGLMLPSPISVIASIQFSADIVSSPGVGQPWSNTLYIDFGPALQNAGFNPTTNGVTGGEVVINNTLVALSEADPNTVAQIVKKDFKINPLTVPEPGSFALLGIAGAFAAARRRR